MIAARPPAHGARRPGPPAKRGRTTYIELDPARNRTPVRRIQPLSSSSTPSPAVNETSNASDSDNDAALFSHNLIFQKAILETLDRETERFEDELREKADELNEIRASKEDMAIFLAHQLKENKRLQKQLTNAQSALESANNKSKTVSKNAEALESHTKQLEVKKRELETQVSKLSSDLEKSKNTVRGTQLATAAFHADIKVRALTQARLERDVEDKNHRLDEARQKIQGLERKVQDDDINHSNQLTENQKLKAMNTHLQNQVSDLERRLKNLTTDYATVEKELKSTKRRLVDSNLAYEKAESRRGADYTAIRDAERICTQLELELNRTAERAEASDRECGTLRNRMAEIQMDLERERIRRNELEDQTIKSGILDGGRSAVLIKVEKDLDRCRKTITERDASITELHAALANEKHKNKELLASKREEMAAAEATLAQASRESEIERAKLEQVRFDLQNRIARMKVEEERLRGVLTEISTQHFLLCQNHIVLKKRVAATDGDIVRSEYAHAQTKRRENTLIDRLRRGLEADKSEETTKLNVELAAVKKEYAKVSKELDSMRAAWLAAQREVVAAKEKLLACNAVNGHMKSAAAVAMEAKRNISRDMDKLGTALSESRVKKDLVKLQLQQATKHAASLRQERATLQTKLEDITKLLQGKEAEYKAGVNVLKGTIGVLQRQLREKKQTQHEVLKREAHTRSRHKVLEEQLARAKEELAAVKSQFFELRAKVGKERRHGGGSAAKAAIGHIKGLEALMLRRRMERMKKNSGKSVDVGARRKDGGDRKSKVKDPGGSGSNGNREGMALGGVPTATLKLNKALSVGAERLHEIVILKNKLEVSEKRAKDAQEKCRVLQDQIQMNGGAVESIAIANRALRAEVMAASMEQQLIAALNSLKKLSINETDRTSSVSNPFKPSYEYYPEIEVSQKLNAVLSETSWLASADDIANGLKEHDLESMC